VASETGVYAFVNNLQGQRCYVHDDKKHPGIEYRHSESKSDYKTAHFRCNRTR